MNGKYELFEGDCLEVMPTLPKKSVDLGIVDPPYNIGKDTWDKFPSHEAYIEWMGRLFLEYQRVLKDNGSFYWFHSEMETIAELMLWIKENTDFVFKQFIVWNKRFEGAKLKGYLDGYVAVEQDRNYRKMAEYCLYYTFQDETGLTQILPLCFDKYLDYMSEQKETSGLSVSDINNITGYKSIASHWFWQPQRKQPQPRFIQEYDYKKLQSTGYFQRPYESLRREYEDLRYTFNNQKTHHSVWNYEIAKANGHATPKPPELIKNIIRHSSNEGDVVLDACAGSGTTGEAAIELGRYPILIELGSDNCESIRQRLGKAQPTLFEAPKVEPDIEQSGLL